MTSTSIPTAKLVIEFDPSMSPDEANEHANAQILAKAAELIVAGEPPRFEVWYPNTTPDNFDAVEVHEDGSIVTFPSYEELTK